MPLPENTAPRTLLLCRPAFAGLKLDQDLPLFPCKTPLSLVGQETQSQCEVDASRRIDDQTHCSRQRHFLVQNAPLAVRLTFRTCFPNSGSTLDPQSLALSRLIFKIFPRCRPCRPREITIHVVIDTGKFSIIFALSG